MTLGGWAFEKGKRGPNESKFTLFTIGTAFRRLSIKKRQVKITTFQEKQKTFHFLYFCTYLGGAWNLTIMNIDKNSDGYKNYVESILLAILRLSLFDAKYINAITRQRTMSGFHKTAY